MYGRPKSGTARFRGAAKTPLRPRKAARRSRPLPAAPLSRAQRPRLLAGCAAGFELGVLCVPNACFAMEEAVRTGL